MAAKAFLVAFGAVSAGASECSNTTFLGTWTPYYEYSGDVSVGSDGYVWFADTTSGGGAVPTINHGAVWSCPKDQRHQCMQMGGEEWGRPQGIAVDDSGDVPYLFVADRGENGNPKVKQCTYDELQLSCTDFGSGWNSPSDVVVDNEGSIFILDMSGADGRVWRCSRSAVCSWIDGFSGDGRLAVDSQGTVYSTSSYRDSWRVSRCPLTGYCSNFYSGSNHVGRRVSAVAVGPDDGVYLNVYFSHSDDQLLIRCPPDHVWDEWQPDHDCETVGAFDDVDGNMVIDEDGAFYTAGGGGRRICLSPAIQDIQV